jgi:hypothetical protein
MPWLLFVILLCGQGVDAAEPGDLDFVVASSLPPAVEAALHAERQRLSPYVLSAHLNPYYLQADFDGDRLTDTAILLKQRATGKSGILVIGGDGRIAVLGAGDDLGNGGDDFRWMDAWHVYPRAEVQRGAAGDAPPLLRGDALMVEKTESASALLYWTGDEFRWYQQGD